ncbi:unnamed protein product, partial [marine sediment metagenome]
VGSRDHKRLWARGEVESVVAFGQPEDGSAGGPMGAEQHDVFPVELGYGGVVHGFDGIGYIGWGEDRIIFMPPYDGSSHGVYPATRWSRVI